MKKVAIMITKPPHGKYLSSEGLRVATALTLYDMEIYVIAIDDGVYTFKKGVDMTTYEKHVDYLLESEMKIMLDEKDATERKISQKDVIEGVTVVPHEEIKNILSQCNTTLIF